MAPFQYTTSHNPFASSIADLMARRGDIAARAAEQQGQAWAGAAGTIGAAASGALQQAADPRRQMESIQLAKAKELQAGQAQVDTMLKGDPLPAGAAGPRQESYTDATGLFDVPKLHAGLAQMGLGHLAPELLKGAESINEAITKHQALEQQAGQAKTLLYGDMADGALKLVKIGMPIDAALDFVAQPGLATKRIAAPEYAQIKQQIASLPPEQQTAALTAFMDAAAKLGGNKTLAEGASEVDRYNRVIATGAPKPKTPTELALDLSSPDPDVRARAKTAIDALHPAARRTDAEMALDAYAKSIGKTKAEDLSYDDRQTFDKNKTAITSSAAFQQHIRERQYDNAHPAPVKDADQGKLEQQYRTVLTRAMSSRSGGIGAEDAKVQQANHLMSLFEQTYNPKTGGYDIPRVQLNELALGLAKLTAGQGPAGEGMLKEFQQHTAKGDLAGALTYLTGQPIATNTQAITTFLKDSIERQGKTAEQNREGEMAYLRGLAPTELEESRRQALEATSLNPLRQSRVIQHTKTGERKMQTSADGGKTWK